MGKFEIEDVDSYDEDARNEEEDPITVDLS